MDNKEFLLKTLRSLSESWDWALVLIQNLESNNYDEKTIDYLAEEMRNSINEVKDESVKKQIWKGLDIIKKISEMEKSDNEATAKDLLDMEKMLEDM